MSPPVMYKLLWLHQIKVFTLKKQTLVRKRDNKQVSSKRVLYFIDSKMSMFSNMNVSETEHVLSLISDNHYWLGCNGEMDAIDC